VIDDLANAWYDVIRRVGATILDMDVSQRFEFVVVMVYRARYMKGVRYGKENEEETGGR
jgi:hypothetical protein